MTSAEKGEVLDSLAGVMTGFMASAIAYSTMINLFIARWLQALLFNPGGFREEFQALRLGRTAAIATVIAVFLSALLSGGITGFSINLIILAVAVFSIHGLALAHAIVAMTRVHRGWLYALYVSMLFIPPQIMVVLSALGFTDCWIDFRARLANRPTQS